MSLDDRARGELAVERLLAAEAREPERGVVEREQGAGRERGREREQAVEDRPRGVERNLLFEYGQDERGEARLALPHRRRAVHAHYAREVSVDLRERPDAARERRPVQSLRRHPRELNTAGGMMSGGR